MGETSYERMARIGVLQGTRLIRRKVRRLPTWLHVTELIFVPSSSAPREKS